jgi:hypothetical protein
VEYLQKNHPESLPRFRGELQGISEQTNQPESDFQPRSHRSEQTRVEKPAAAQV